MKIKYYRDNISESNITLGAYSNTTFSFAFGSAPVIEEIYGKKEKVVTQLTRFNTCRELFAGNLISQVNGRNNHNIDLKRLRILMYIERYHHERVRYVLKVLNHIEEKLKWPKSKITKITGETKPAMNKNAHIYYFDASSKWLRSPHSISLYCLIARTIIISDSFENMKKPEEFINYCKDINACYYDNHRINSHKTNDEGHIAQTFHKWFTYLRGTDMIFKKFKVKDAYKGLGNDGTDGITKLVCGKSNNKFYQLKVNRAEEKLLLQKRFGNN